VKRLIVSTAAKADLTAIGHYTAETLGVDQRARYLGQIRARFLQLQRNPDLGRVRDEIRRGYRSISCGRHVIVYRETDDMIEILRILHDRMDLHQQLADPSPGPS
jgi:toxin ParE1/3/4